jgi:hypothetical protein
MMPTPRLSQTSRNAATSATPTANRYAVLSVIIVLREVEAGERAMYFTRQSDASAGIPSRALPRSRFSAT